MENSENIVESIKQTINNLFSNLFSSVDNSLYGVLDDLLFVNSDIFNNQYFEKLLGNFNSGGILLICNALLLGFTIYYAFYLALSYLTFSQVQRPSQFIFKLLFASIAINFSLFIVEKFVYIFFQISLSIREVGEYVLNQNICLSHFIDKFNSTIYLNGASLNLFSIDGLIKSFTSVGFFNLAVSYAIRYILIQVFIIFSPFAFISLINTNTSWIFKSWLKLFLSLLSLQILVPLIILISFSLDSGQNNTFSKIISLGSIYSLIKANTFIKEFMSGLSTDVNLNLSNFFLTKLNRRL